MASNAMRITLRASRLTCCLLSRVACAGQQSPKGVAAPSPAATPCGLDARLLGRVRRARRARPGEVGLRDRLHPQQGSAVLHGSPRERAGRRRDARHRGAEGALPGLRLHLGQHQHVGAVRVPLRARRGAREAPDRHRHVARVWMLGVNRKEVGWPACGEIDIMENVGFDPLRIVGSVHTAAYNHTIGTHKSANVDGGESLGGLPRLRDGVVRGPHRHLRGRAEVLHVPQRGDRFARPGPSTSRSTC